MRMKPATRKIRMSKKLKLHIRKTRQDIRELNLTGNNIDRAIAQLLDESIGLHLFQYTQPNFSYEAQNKAEKRLKEIQKSIDFLTEKRVEDVITTSNQEESIRENDPIMSIDIS